MGKNDVGSSLKFCIGTAVNSSVMGSYDQTISRITFVGEIKKWYQKLSPFLDGFSDSFQSTITCRGYSKTLQAQKCPEDFCVTRDHYLLVDHAQGLRNEYSFSLKL